MVKRETDVDAYLYSLIKYWAYEGLNYKGTYIDHNLFFMKLVKK